MVAGNLIQINFTNMLNSHDQSNRFTHLNYPLSSNKIDSLYSLKSGVL